MPGFFQIRKEVFSPSEQLTNPTTVHLVFCQASFSFLFFSFTRYIYCLVKLTDLQFRSSLTHSARCASAWLSLRGRRWWATWTNTTSAPRTSTAHSIRTLQRWDLKNKKISQHRISNSNCQVNIISMAKDFSTYFSRIYPVASNDQEVWITMTNSWIK